MGTWHQHHLSSPETDLQILRFSKKSPNKTDRLSSDVDLTTTHIRPVILCALWWCGTGRGSSRSPQGRRERMCARASRADASRQRSDLSHLWLRGAVHVGAPRTQRRRACASCAVPSGLPPPSPSAVVLLDPSSIRDPRAGRRTTTVAASGRARGSIHCARGVARGQPL